MSRLWRRAVVAALVAGCGPGVVGQAPAQSGPPAGWFALYRAADGSAAVDDHVARAAFALREGESVHPAIAPRGLIAAYSGMIRIDEPGRYRFGAEWEGGAVTIELHGEAIGEAVVGRPEPVAQGTYWTGAYRLQPGLLSVRYEFRRDGNEPARLRAMWKMEREGLAGFGAEPIPTRLVRVPPALAQRAAAAQEARLGRVLLGELGCVACHRADAHQAAVLDRPAPDLRGIGDRVGRAWLQRWIVEPQAVKPGSPMPDVIGTSRRDLDDAEAIVAFLSTLGPTGAAPLPAVQPAAIQQGRELYHAIGCVACHGPIGMDLPDDPPVPLGDLRGKWRRPSLARMLQDPTSSRPGGRMPAMGLSEAEADAIAAFLLASLGEAPAGAGKPVGGDVHRGRAAFVARRCANCHEVEGVAPAADGLRGLTALRPGRGCLAERDDRAPRYTLSATQRDALEAALREARGWVAPAPIDEARRRVAALQCAACHQWEDTGGVRATVRGLFTTRGDAIETELGDEGRLPPTLTGAGDRLTTTWLSAVLHDGARARPYMAARMPQFGRAALGPLEEQLCALDGIWPDTDRRGPEPTDELIRVGRALVGSSGLNCISCHVVGDLPPAGTAGTDLTGMVERHRYEWWNRFIQAPARERPGTRMPNFFWPAPVMSVLDGDPQRQSDAIWAYLSLGSFMPPPEGLTAPAGLPVVVGDEPVVLRTFLASAGSRGIAVGFPEGVHFAFDAETCRLVEAWRGAFLDAAGAWAGRGGTVTPIQGVSVWTAPPGPALIAGGESAATSANENERQRWRFRGYVLDESGRPTFLYDRPARGGTVSVAERFEPVIGTDALFRRHLVIEGLAAGETVQLRAGGREARIVQLEGAAAASPDTVANGGWLVFRREASARPMRLVVEILP